MLGGFSKNILTKTEIARVPVVRFALKPSQVGFDVYRFGWCAREVQENSVAWERVDLRFWKCAPFSETLRSFDDFPTFCTLSISMVHEWSQWIEAILVCKYCVKEFRRVSRTDYWGVSGSWKNIEKLDIFMIFLTFQDVKATQRILDSF